MSQDTTSFLEDLLSAVTQSALSLVADYQAEQSGRPFGWEAMDVWERLEHWLDVRDDPTFYQQHLAEQAQLYGQHYAELAFIRDITQMEQQLDAHGGPDAVLSRQMLGRLGPAQRAVNEAEALLALPPIEIRAPLPPPRDPLWGVMQQAGQPQTTPAIFGYQQPPRVPPFPPAPAHDIGMSTYGPTNEPVLGVR